MLDQNLLKSHLYNTFVLPQMTKQNDMIHSIEVEAFHDNKGTNSQTRYRSTSRDRFSYDKSTTPPQYTRSRYDNSERDSRSYRSPY